MQVEQAVAGVGSIDDARRALYRQQILAAAELEFSRAGFGDTKVSAIAQSAGLSLATLYKHFAGKTEIWDDLHSERMQALLAELEPSARDATTALDRLIAGVSTVARFLMAHDAYLEMNIRAGAGWANSTELAVGVQKTVWSAGIGMIEAGLKTARANGEMRDLRPSIAARLVVSALQVWMIDWVSSGRTSDPESVVEDLATHLRWTLAKPALTD